MRLLFEGLSARALPRLNHSANNLVWSITQLRGWAQRFAALTAGLISVLSLAPFFFWPVLFVTFPILVWLIDGAVEEAKQPPAPIISQNSKQNPRRASSSRGKPYQQWHQSTPFRVALIGWWFAFGYFAAGLFWIGEAFLVEADKFAILMPLAVTILPAGLALFWALGAGLAARFWAPGFARILALVVSLSAIEWLRGHILTGFPWNLPGYALTYPLVLMQSASVLGIYGLTLVALILFTAPLVLWFDADDAQPRHARGVGQMVAIPTRHEETAHEKTAPGETAPGELATAAQVAGIVSGSGKIWSLSRSRQLALTIAVLPLLLVALFGWLRLHSAELVILPDIRLKIVQPSIPQKEKWRADLQLRNFQQHLALSRTSADGASDDLSQTTLVIWPEAAMPFLPLREPNALAAIGKMLPAGTVLLAGALRVETASDKKRGTQAPRTQAPRTQAPRTQAPRSSSRSRPVKSERSVFNSVLTFDQNGQPGPHYDKTHLVPFGEYLPLNNLLTALGLRKLVEMPGNFNIGPSPRPLLQLKGLPPIGILICYEAIFPGVVAKAVGRPGLFINVTNDGWFGASTGPHQHLHQARLRAVEEGIPIIRSANNGISAVIGPFGRILHRLDLNVVGVIDTDLPAALRSTLYSRFGDTVFGLMWLISLIFLGRLTYWFGWKSP